MGLNALYKFIKDPRHAEYLLSGKLKFTPIPELNDPTELIPRFVIHDVRESLAKLRRNGYSNSEFHHLQRQGNLLEQIAPEVQGTSVPRSIHEANQLLKSRFYDDMTNLEKLLNRTMEILVSRVGIFCMTYRMDSLPMWAHYADHAKGLVVEFGGLEKTFAGDATGILARLIEVIYHQDLTSITFNPCSHEYMFYSKFSDWSYEHEVRIVLPLDKCTKCISDECTVHTYKIPLCHVRRIYCGWNIGCDMLGELIGYTRSINPSVEVWTTTISSGHVRRGERVFP